MPKQDSKGPQLERKGLVMVSGGVKAETGKGVGKRKGGKKAAARSKAVRTARFQLFQCITKG